MAHQQNVEADNSPAPTSKGDLEAEVLKFFDGETGDQPDDPIEEKPEAVEGEQPEAQEGDDEEAEADEHFDEDDDLEEGDELDDEESDEGDAIEPPASLNAKEKAVFAQLPKEVQQAWAASETRRNKQVQEATTKAAEAQRAAEARAAEADIKAKREYAEQLNKFVSVFAPTPPDPALAEQDPQAFIAMEAKYRAAAAQHEQLVQQIRAIEAESDAQEREAFIAQRDRELMQIPEIANEETRDTTIAKAFEAAEFLGYNPKELAESMSASDFKALLKIAQIREKAEKYDRAMAKKMKKVRAAKGKKNLRPSTDPHAEPRVVKAERALERLKQVRTDRNAAAAVAEELFEAAGIL